MPEAAGPVVAAPAAAPTEAKDQVTAPELPQTPQPTTETAEQKEARRVARIENSRKQADRLKQERIKFQEEQSNWKAVSAQALREAGEMQRLRKLAAEDPVKALEAMGHKFEDVLKKTANRGALTQETVDAMVKEQTAKALAEFKAQMDEFNRVKSIKDREAFEAQQIQNAQRQIAETYEANKDSYEFIDDSPATLEDAWKLCVETYQATMDPKTSLGGIKLTWKEALDKLEEKALEYHEQVQEKSKKLKTRLEAKAAEAAKKKAEEAAKAAPARPTWPRRKESVASPAPLAAALSAPEPIRNQQVPTRRNIADIIRERQERARSARASNDA
jgi:hypothetical protein